MPRKYWKTQKYPEFIQNRREYLDNLLSLVNADLDAVEDKASKVFMENYLKFIASGITRAYEDQNRERHLDYIERLVGPAPSPQVAIECKNFARAIKSHLVLRLHVIIEASMSQVEIMVWEIPGRSLKINIDPIYDRLMAKFSFGEIEIEDHTEDGKRFADISLIELISELDLKPRRFRQCPKCRTFFYQPTSREKFFAQRSALIQLGRPASKKGR